MRRHSSFVLPLLAFLVALVSSAWIFGDHHAEILPAFAKSHPSESLENTPSMGSVSKRAFSTDDEMLTTIMSAVAEEEPLLRAHRLHDLLSHLSSAELAVLFKRAVLVDDRDRREAVLPALLSRWAAIDLAGATAAVRPYRERLRGLAKIPWQSLDSAVNDAWAAAVPKTALAEAMSAPLAPWARETAWAAIQALGNGDPARKLDELARLPANRLRDEMCEAAIQELATKDSAAAEARLDLLSEPKHRSRLQAEILGKLAERDPAASLARLAELSPDLIPGTTGTRLVTSVLRTAAKKDASAALAALDGLPDELYTQALGAVLVGWSGEHPLDALEWASANGVDLSEMRAVVYFGGDSGAGWNSVVGTALGTDREKTLGWLRTQPASLERDSMLREGLWNGTSEQRLEVYAEMTPAGRANAAWSIVDGLTTENPDRAKEWIKGLASGPERISAINAYAGFEVNNDPERLDTLAAQWPIGPDRDAALQGVATGVAYNDPRRALDFARQMGDADRRETAFENIARNWLYRDEAAARVWLANATELPAEVRRVLLRGASGQ